MTQFRPQLIKLDRELVAGVDGDEVKLALVEMLGEFGGRIDAWLVAEGIETWGELQAFLRLRVPLGQGWLLGRPGPPWVQLEPEVRDRLRRQAAQALLTEHVAGLAEPILVVEDGTAPDGRSASRSTSTGTRAPCCYRTAAAATHPDTAARR
jgi:EAL domain-containing protein